MAISRSSAYRGPTQVSAEELGLLRKLDELHLRHPFKGSRRLRDDLWDKYGLQVNRKRVQRLMNVMGISALHPGAKTTKRNPQHKIYPYLLRRLEISKVNQVWCMRIPDETCHRFQSKPATHSRRKLPPIPEQSCHP